MKEEAQTTSQVSRLFSNIREIGQEEFDVLIIGSGPAGSFFTRRLFDRLNSAARGDRVKVGLLERGGVLALNHINNLFPNGLRRKFIDCFKIHPWEGDFRRGGMILPALGGRGIASGAHLRRFDEADLRLWPNGQWPESIIERLPKYYDYMERLRRVSQSSIRGPLQMWATGLLRQFNPHVPPIGLDNWSTGGFEVARGVDSPIFHLWSLLLQEHMCNGHKPRLSVAVGAMASAIGINGGQATEVTCHEAFANGHGRPFKINARRIVLAASTVESARILLNSGAGKALPLVGRYLAEHVERRSKIQIAFDPMDTRYSQGVSLVLSPASDKQADRFQVHLRGEVIAPGQLIVDIGGFAAVDPTAENCVTLSSHTDEFGIRKADTRFQLTAADKLRTERMCARILEVADILGGKFITQQFPLEDSQPKFLDESARIQVMDPGRSYHECGTLRMGHSPENSVTDPTGRVHGISNLWVADASLFPSVGIANPMLTIGALASMVADNVFDTL